MEPALSWRFVSSVRKWVVVALILGVAAVIWLPDDEPAPSEAAAVDAVIEIDTGRFDPSWWQSAEASCPEGGLLRGGPPPDGFEVWCERTDGTRHGQHVSWWPNGRRAFERTYRDGKLDGTWAEWRADGRRWTSGEYSDGLRHGRWVSWDDAGIATVTDYDRGRAATP
jgi:hypothetical protein